METITTIYLVLLSIFDIKKKKIPLFSIIIPLIIMAAVLCISGKTKTMLWGMLPGIFVSLLSYFSVGSIGLGDGLLIVLYGAYYGWQKACLWVVFSFWLAAIWGICMVACKKQKKILPFIPFLTCVHIGGQLCGIF